MSVKMKEAFLLLLITAVAQGLDAGVRTKFDIGLELGSKFYYSMPMSVSEALAQNYVATARPDGPLPSLELYCPSERHVCIMYDDTGYIAGMQMAVEQEEFTDAVLDWETQGFSEWTVNGTKYWTLQQYYVDEDFLARDPEERIASRNSEKTLQLDGVWVTSFNKQLMKIPISSEQMKTNNFVEQTCFPGMGTHYYYNLTEDSTCDSGTLLPWYPLVYSGELVGTIFATVGKLPVKDDRRDWFERSPRAIIQLNFLNAPTCLLDYVSSPGLLSVHIFFVNDPWMMTCLFQ